MKKILIVSPNSDYRERTSEILRSNDYITLEAHEAAEGLYMASVQNPDLIVTDISFKEMNGFEFVTLLRKNMDLAFVPCVFLLSKGIPREMRYVDLLIATDYLVIPFIESELVNCVRRNLQQNEMGRKQFENEYNEVLSAINTTERTDVHSFVNSITGFAHLLIKFSCLPSHKRNNFLMAIYNSGVSLRTMLSKISNHQEIKSNQLLAG